MFEIFTTIGIMIVLIGIVKLIDNFEEERERKKSNLTRDEYDEHKNLENRYHNERYGMGDDEEYLKVIEKMKMSGISDEYIESLIKKFIDEGITGVNLTESLRFLVNEEKIKDKKRNFDEKWLDEI